MEHFISYKTELEALLSAIVQDNEIHAKWLNTLSYMENCGARKIAKCQHPTKVKEIMLKHASEEFRHAYYLKQQLSKIDAKAPETYAVKDLLGEYASLHYLNILDIQICQFLKSQPSYHPEAAYLLVTYAIELRASELYPLYENALKAQRSTIRVKSIVLEEEEHLAEMEQELQQYPHSFKQHVCQIESRLCQHWIKTIKLNLNSQSL